MPLGRNPALTQQPLYQYLSTYVLMSEILKTEVNRALARRFKKKAMETYGYKKGAVKKALEELITGFSMPGRTDWLSLKGAIKADVSSVELQHRALRDAD